MTFALAEKDKVNKLPPLVKALRANLPEHAVLELLVTSEELFVGWCAGMRPVAQLGELDRAYVVRRLGEAVSGGRRRAIDDGVAGERVVDHGSCFDAAEFDSLLKGVLDACGNLSSASVVQASELVEGIKQEMALEKPKKNVVGALLTGLKGLNGGVQLTAAVAALTEFVMPLFG